MSKSYEKVIKDFEKAVFQMQKDLEYLAEQNSLSTKFFDKQNHILYALIEYHNRSQSYIQYLEQEVLEEQKVRRSQLRKYEDHIVAFEAIAIIHGIVDFPMWLSKGKMLLIWEAEELGKEQRMRFPSLFMDKLKRLTPTERNTVISMLQKDIDKEISRLLNRVNKEIKKGQYGIRPQRYTPKL